MMITTLVHIWVKEAFIDSFIKATVENHEQSVNESGNLRFDILQDAGDPAKFVLYEAYKTEQDAAEHKQTAHYFKWRDQVAEWMEQPRQGVKHYIIHPTNPEKW